jgi:hypothetical protein
MAVLDGCKDIKIKTAFKKQQTFTSLVTNLASIRLDSERTAEQHHVKSADPSLERNSNMQFRFLHENCIRYK